VRGGAFSFIKYNLVYIAHLKWSSGNTGTAFMA
jgi:hypothetical protein